MKPITSSTISAAFASTILASVLVASTHAQTQTRIPNPPAPSFDVKTPAEPSVQTFPSERAARPHAPALPSAERGSVPIDSVNRDPANWLPNGSPAGAPKIEGRHVDPNLPSDRVRPIDHSAMQYLTQDGTLWARGEHYKASFGAAGATYIPVLGRRQPHDVLHALSPDRVTIGGEELAFERTAPAVRDGDHVALDRGAFTEAYELAPQSVEQTFVFASLPRTGELVVHIPVASELDGVETSDGLEFRGDFGRVTYGRATVIDAAGRRETVATKLENGSITIDVDAAFVASATLPLVIDPVVSTFPIDNSSLDQYWADAAYDAGTHTWLVVYEDWVSSTDRDAYYAFLNDTGVTGAGFWLDGSTNSWDSLHVANNAVAHQFMIVSSVTSGNQVYVLASSIYANGTFGTQTVVTGTETGSVRNCVIGGDPYTGGGPSYYCIAYERQFSSTDWDILVRLIAPNGALLGAGPNYFSNSGGTIDVGPAISKSNGAHDWMVGFQRNNGYVNDADVWGGIVHWDGSIFAAPFQISAWYQAEWQVAVSSPLNGSMRYLVTWQDTDGGDHDIIMALLDGATKLDQQDLSIDDQYNYTLDQIESSVDSDGDHFLVAYSELYSWPDYDLYASDVYVSAQNTLALAQRHVNLDYDTTKDHTPRVVGCKMSGTSDSANPNLHHRFLVAWNSSPNPSGPADVRGAFFDNFDAGQATSYCFGDGTGAACPCGNNGFTGHGCQNSSATGGGLLIASGVASLASDTLLFTTQNEKPSALSTVTQGDTAIAPIAFGQGLRCAGGHLKRLYTKTAFSGSITAPASGDPSVHARSAALGDTIGVGSTRYYYVYYRDATVLGGCSAAATFNNTQSVSVVWAQ
jgi:hypothetical protein